MRAGDAEFDAAVEATIELLREVARNSRTESDALITYRQLSERLAERGVHIPYYQGPMPHILEEASLREQAAGRAMISALVVQQGTNGRPSEPSGGFYRLARRVPFQRRGDNQQIWWNELRQVLAENALTQSQRGGPVTLDNLGAWMVKCNPAKWDLATFLDSGEEVITRWSVVPSYRTRLMAEGQRVLFWVTGRDGTYPEAGLWGAGTVLGPAWRQDITGEDPGFWLDEGQRQRTQHFAPVDIHLFERPIPRQVLKDDPRLAGMEVFRQPQMGNPLVVSKEELAVLDALLPAQPQQITVSSSGAGFGNPITNRLVETAAMDAVRAHYEAMGWQVTDDSRHCYGWDVTCTSPTGAVDRVEVKGVSGSDPSILLTRNEFRSAREDQGWRLAVVTKALAAPEVQFFDAETAVRAAEPMMFQVDLRRF
ncbi:protein NO VEIN domain-containing protein [Micromonospora sp. IBHARD004]|uniref:protein NO VEIN domain-containing protein n=1 Tax=Micromonospora sp. IBHARD004 TaxID=3457764 RepID=UPI004059AF7B